MAPNADETLEYILQVLASCEQLQIDWYDVVTKTSDVEEATRAHANRAQQKFRRLVEQDGKFKLLNGKKVVAADDPNPVTPGNSKFGTTSTPASKSGKGAGVNASTPTSATATASRGGRRSRPSKADLAKMKRNAAAEEEAEEERGQEKEERGDGDGGTIHLLDSSQSSSGRGIGGTRPRGVKRELFDMDYYDNSVNNNGNTEDVDAAIEGNSAANNRGRSRTVQREDVRSIFSQKRDQTPNGAAKKMKVEHGVGTAKATKTEVELNHLNDFGRANTGDDYHFNSVSNTYPIGPIAIDEED